MFNWLKSIFKKTLSLNIYDNDLTNLYKTINHYKTLFKNIDPINDNLLYIEIIVVDKNILYYIAEIHKYLIEENSSIPNILYRHDHNSIYFIDFIKNDDGKVMLNSNMLLLNLLDNVYDLLMVYENTNDRKLHQYIMHVINIFKALESGISK